MSTLEELARRVAELEQRLCAAEDVQQISNLKARYGELADRRYLPEGGRRQRAELEKIATQIAELFCDDAEWDGGPALGVARGREEIRARFLEPTLEFSWHYFVKPQIHVDGDRARASWDVLAPCTTRDGRPHWMAGWEQDEYRRVAGVWLHTRMKLEVVFMAPYERGWRKSPRP